MSRKVNLEKVRASLSTLLAVFFLVQTGIATSVVTLIDRKHHKIVIGADSLIVGSKGSRNACKIIETPDCVFAPVGVYDLTQTHFDLQTIAKTACRSPGNIEQKADEFLRIAKGPAEEAANYVRLHAPDFFRSEIANPRIGDYFDVIFAGMNRFGVLEVSSRGFSVNDSGVLTPSSVDQSDLTPGRDFALFSGARDDIDVYLKGHRNVWNELDFADIAKKLVQVEIDSKPNDVGLPISILEINRNGVHTWIQPGLCGQPETRQRNTPKTNK